MSNSNQLVDALAEADPFQSWWPFIVAIGVGVVMTIRTFMGGQPNPAANDVPGQVCIVTGASGGIGLQIARELCRRKATVILACRNLPKAQAAMDALLKQMPDANCEVRHLDLSSLASVRHFASGICADYPAVHALINNAGVMLTGKEPQLSVDGHEMHLQVNYLAPVLLAELLRERLDRVGGRVVNTTAHAYAAAGQFVSAEDPLNVGEWRRAYHHRDAFALSKLLLVLWTHRTGVVNSKKDGDGGDDNKTTTMNVYSPGFVRGTEHLRQSQIMRSTCAHAVIFPWMWVFMKTAVQGAQTALYLVTEPSLANVGGKYFNDCEASELLPFATEERLVTKAYEETRRVLAL